VSAAYVRLTTFAFEDLKELLKVDPQIVRKALTKMILLERDPTAGEPLLGNLVGWRKLTVGNRDWRVVWRIGTDDSGATVIDIAEVWAVGARSDSEIYDEMKARLAAAGPSESTIALSAAVELLGRSVKDVRPTPEPVLAPIPEWLSARLKHQAGMSDSEIGALTPEQAMVAWELFITRER
jgi:mRNA interferase RelE/StbE